MIRINLLPVEKRKAERTPLPRFGLIVVDVGVLTLVVFGCAYLLLQINNVRRDINNLKTEVASLEPDVQRHQQLTSQIKTLEATLGEISRTAGRPVEWWRAMDALWEVIHFNPRIWVDEITVLDAKTAETQAKSYNPEFIGLPPYGLYLKCHCAGRDVKELTKFRMDLKRSQDLAKFFQEINWDAQWSVEDEKEFVEQYSMQFDVRLIGRQQLPGMPGAAPAGVAR